MEHFGYDDPIVGEDIGREGTGEHVGLELKEILEKEKERLRRLEEQWLRAKFKRELEEESLIDLNQKMETAERYRGIIRVGAGIAAFLGLGMFFYMRHAN